ncbi:MAG: hypothetical protein JSV52_13185 [Candidatus Zixiibacteriota bacterium]|nr:MAG: hypothetical protein JSV52_13185 [candidate division Zixibacteria bacterium]
MGLLRLVLRVLAIVVSLSASACTVEIVGLDIKVNAKEVTEIWFTFTLSEEIDDISSSDSMSDSTLDLKLRRESDDSVVVNFPEDCLGFGVSSVTFKLVSPSRHLATYICSGEDSHYLEPAANIVVVTYDGSIDILTPDEVKSFSLSSIEMTERDCERLKRAQATDSDIYDFTLDLAREIKGDDSAETEYAITYSYRRPTAIPYVGFESAGRLSNNRYNPMNNIRFRLLANTRPKTISMAKKEFSGQLFVEAGLSGNQTLDTSSAGVHFGLEAVTPNLVDLTGGENRMRLKPIVKLGGGYVRHFQNQPLFGGKRDTWELFIDLYYYIPVAKEFALIWEAHSRFSEDIELSDHWIWRQSVMFAYDLPLEDLKALVKWESGRNGFTIEKDSKLLIGLLMNYIPQ